MAPESHHGVTPPTSRVTRRGRGALDIRARTITAKTTGTRKPPADRSRSPHHEPARDADDDRREQRDSMRSRVARALTSPTHSPSRRSRPLLRVDSNAVYAPLDGSEPGVMRTGGSRRGDSVRHVAARRPDGLAADRSARTHRRHLGGGPRAPDTDARGSGTDARRSMSIRKGGFARCPCGKRSLASCR
jgi:hypothetical protein